MSPLESKTCRFAIDLFPYLSLPARWILLTKGNVECCSSWCVALKYLAQYLHIIVSVFRQIFIAYYVPDIVLRTKHAMVYGLYLQEAHHPVRNI